MVSGELIRIHWDTLGYIGIRLVNQDTLGGIVIVNLDTEEGTASNIWGPRCQSAALSAQPKKKILNTNTKTHICKYKNTYLQIQNTQKGGYQAAFGGLDANQTHHLHNQTLAKQNMKNKK